MNNKKIYIITGHYGSGKTEFAVNLALYERKKGKKVVICDLDIVNPYFRTKDAEKLLKENGVRMIASPYANTNIEVPTLPADIISAFDSDDDVAIFDVGGDEEGAVALGRFKAYFEKHGYEMLFVVNLKRPITENAEASYQILREIEIASRLKVTAIVNNTNLSYLSTGKELIESREEIYKLCKISNLPLKYVLGDKKVFDLLFDDYKKIFFPMDLFLHLPWEG